MEGGRPEIRPTSRPGSRTPDLSLPGAADACGPHRRHISRLVELVTEPKTRVPMSVAFRVAPCRVPVDRAVCAGRRPRRWPPEPSSRNTSSSPSTARMTSRNGSAAARWRRAPARASPISCPASSCCRRRHAARLPGARQAAGQVRMSVSRSRRQEVADAAATRSGWRASEGHEIASHGCGHFDGKRLEQGRLAGGIRVLPTHPARCLHDQRHRRRAGRLARFRRQRGDRISRALSVDRQGALRRRSRTPASRYDASGVSRGPVEPEPTATVVALRAAA